MKVKAIVLTLILASLLLAGCGGKNDNKDGTSGTPTPTTNPGDGTDAVTTASIVNTANNFEGAISSNGTWIICLQNDLSIDKDLILTGEFTNGKKDDAGKDIIQRKIALYTQDADRNITNRFTLTVPKLTIESPNASIQHGTFVGDLYVNVPNFQLIDAKVEGNVYFKDAGAQSTFTMDETSSITGKQELQQ